MTTKTLATRLLTAAMLTAGAAAMTAPAAAADVDFAAQVAELGGDAAKGERVYNRCKACHVIDKEQNRVGPHQVGIIGRPAAAVADFRYSDAMTAAAADNPATADAGDALVWDAATLKAYLADPKAYVPGTKMAFAGLKKEDEINDVIAYLLSAGGVYKAPTN